VAIVVRRLLAAWAWKTPWLVTVSARWEARSAIEVAEEPSGSKSRNQQATIPDERCLAGRPASIETRDGAARGNPYTYRRKKRKKEGRIGPVRQWR